MSTPRDLNRRRFLGSAFGVGAALAVAPAVAAADPLPAGSAGMPASGSLDAATGSLETLQAAGGMLIPRGPLGMVGVVFPTAEQALGRIRFAFGDGSTGPWQRLTPLDGGAEHGGVAGAEPVSAPAGATGFEVDAPQGTRATVFDDGRGRTDYAQYALRRVDFLGVPVVPRSAWGADDNAGGGWSPVFHRPQCITIHHTAMACGPDRVGNLRSIHNYHAAVLGWGDIGYHLVIDPDGVIYQGRRTALPDQPVFRVPPVAGVAPSVATGGHVYDVNQGNVGISLLGDFTSAPPTAAAVGSCIDLVRALSNAIGIHPTAGIDYRNPETGLARPQRFVSGHRDWGGTSCPGDAFYPQLDFIRDYAARGFNPGLAGAVGPALASPAAGSLSTVY